MIERDHPLEALLNLVSGRLSGAEREDVEAHLESCAMCRAERDRLAWTQERLGSIGETSAVPAERTRQLPSALDAVDASSSDNTAEKGQTQIGESADVATGDESVSWPGAVFSRPVLAFGVPLIMLVAVLIGLRMQSPSLTQRIATDYREFKSEALHLEMETRNHALLEEFFQHRGVDFETRVRDLAMLQYNLKGGRIHQIDPFPSAAFAYEGPAGEYLLCQMYPGTIEGLPAGSTLRVHDGTDFYVYTRGGLTMAFWQDGDVICVLVSDIPSEDLLRLAFAKAMRAMPDGHEAADDHS